jgi:hypothetical protein
MVRIITGNIHSTEGRSRVMASLNKAQGDGWKMVGVTQSHSMHSVCAEGRHVTVPTVILTAVLEKTG